MDLSNLTPIDKNSTRGSNQNWDIHHFVEENKFTVSDALYATLGLDNKGFTAFVNSDEKCVLLAVLPNEESVSYRGREGYTKGKVFTSTEMSKAFAEFGLEGELFLSREGELNGTTYYLVSETDTTQTETSDTNMADIEATEDVEETNETQTEELV